MIGLGVWCFKVQLVGRHLIFTDATGSTEEVPRGSAGVVGHTPVLEPGQSFEYYSGMYVVVACGSCDCGAVSKSNVN